MSQWDDNKRQRGMIMMMTASIAMLHCRQNDDDKEDDFVVESHFINSGKMRHQFCAQTNHEMDREASAKGQQFLSLTWTTGEIIFHYLAVFFFLPFSDETLATTRSKKGQFILNFAQSTWRRRKMINSRLSSLLSLWNIILNPLNHQNEKQEGFKREVE